MSTYVNDPMILSQLFHLNSEPWLNEAAYRSAPFVQEFLNLLFELLVQLTAGFGRFDHWLQSWSMKLMWRW